MTIRGLTTNAGITKTVGRPKANSIGYHGNNPHMPYIINYNRNSKEAHIRQSFFRKLLGR